MSNVLVFLSFLWLQLIPLRALAHGAEEEHALESSVTTYETAGQNIQALVTTFTVRSVVLGFALLAVLIFLSVVIKRKTEVVKRILFWFIVLVVMGTTLLLVGSTILVNMNSVTKGPIHWHADFEVWACGEKLDLRNPEGLSNKVGESSFHEHNDLRIHYEGVVTSLKDASLGQFFNVIGGGLTNSSLIMPTNEGKRLFVNGEPCADGEAGEVQAFVYTVNRDQSFQQQKLLTPASYIMNPETQVPPGDCIIIEFDRPKERTEQLCQSYQTALQTGKLKGEVR